MGGCNGAPHIPTSDTLQKLMVPCILMMSTSCTLDLTLRTSRPSLSSLAGIKVDRSRCSLRRGVSEGASDRLHTYDSNGGVQIFRVSDRMLQMQHASCCLRISGAFRKKTLRRVCINRSPAPHITSTKCSDKLMVHDCRRRWHCHCAENLGFCRLIQLYILCNSHVSRPR